MSRFLLSALLTLGLAAPSWAAEPGDFQMFNRVAEEVQHYAFFTIFDSVHVGVDDGVVTLTGKVTMPHKATDIARRVAKVEGVLEVRNEIDVLPVSQFDDELRVSIARAIYSHPGLFMYGVGPNPSIHVIVERGRVTLDGVVMNEQDRVIARSLAAFSGAFSVQNNLKTDEEVRRELEKL
jgi:hyperosmotically inducible protein